MGVSGLLHIPATLSLGKEPPVPIGCRGWVDPRAGLDVVAKRKSLPLLEIESQSSIPLPFTLLTELLWLQIYSKVTYLYFHLYPLGSRVSFPGGKVAGA